MTALLGGAPVAAFEDLDLRMAGVQSPRGGSTPSTASRPRALPARHRGLPADLDDGQHHRRAGRADPRAGRRQAGHLRPVRRRRLRGRGRARAAGDRGPADLRLRRPRPAARRRGRAGREGLRRGDRHRLQVVDAADRFLDALAGVTDPEEKRKIIGREFIRVFEAAEVRVGDAEQRRQVEFLVQGTLYPDVVESGGGTGTANIKSTTTSAACPTTSSSRWSSRCARCSRTRSALVGAELGLPAEIVWRHPFPGPGLAIRIIGEVTASGSTCSARPTRSPARS